jgi:cytochrome P450
LALHRNPDQLAALKADPSLMSNAVEEFLRYDSSVQLTARVALEDIDDLGGKRIPKGETVFCLLGSANRDPAVYPDHPECLDIRRPNVRPLSFGGGIHHCLGAQLARIEAGIAIATLLRRIPELRLDDAANPEWRPTFVLRGSQGAAGELVNQGAVTSPHFSIYRVLFRLLGGGPPPLIRALAGACLKERSCRRRCSDWRSP